jgi:hypothetical protein
MMRSFVFPLAALVLAACATPPAPNDPQAQFFDNLQTLCGQSFTGRLEVGDPTLDKDFAENPLRMGPVSCGKDRVAIPFAVGADASRTWIITRTAAGLTLKHRHAHGESEDALSQYGGDTISPGEPTRQDFPADAFSIALFQRENRPASVENVWSVEITPGARFSYALRRPGRHVQVAFALSPR